MSERSATSRTAASRSAASRSAASRSAASRSAAFQAAGPPASSRPGQTRRLEASGPAGKDAGAPRSGAPGLGARLLDGNRCAFRVWAPLRERVEVHLLAPDERRVPMVKGADGYHEVILENCGEGARYKFALDDGNEWPDPASRSQPDGVHGPSAVVGSDFVWRDEGWSGIALEDSVVYELHVGTFTEEGTFDAVIPRLDALKELGITVIDLLPVAQFPGSRNWGYDGVYAYAAQESYGGARGLKRLVDACHERGLAILLDVVYNHLGPEGNYLSQFGPYFTDRYKTPWGLAMNFDGPHSDDVRRFFIHNALQWIDEFHIDGLRVDAVHAIIDTSAQPFLQDLNTAVHASADQLGRRVLSIAESDLNDPRVITPAGQLGLDFDSQWMDDFHHSVHTLLTGEQDGYYQGFPPRVSNLARVYTTGYFYIGQYSEYRQRKYGQKPKTTNGAQFVISMQNHDQVGNRMLGERLTTLVSQQKVRLAAAAMIFAPFLPMLFMGEEYGETAPFQYFTSHGDPDLIEAVRKGRQEEFDDFLWQGRPPDPHDEETFTGSRLNWSVRDHGEHAELRQFHQLLLATRRDTPALRSLDLESVAARADDDKQVLLVRRWSGDDQVLLAFNFSAETQTVETPGGPWTVMIETGASFDDGQVTLTPHAFGLFRG